MSLQSSSAVTSSDNNLVLGHFNCPFLEWNNSKKRLFILWQEGSSTLKFWGWIQRPSGSRKSARSWSRFVPWVPETFLARFPVSVTFGIVTRASPLVASAYGRRCVGLQPTPEIPAAREKNLWYPGWSLWGTLSKNFQCKSCIKAKSLNGVLAAISSTVCLFFF